MLTVLSRFFLLVLIPLSFASYQYHDYVKESGYHGPAPVNDTLIDNCWNLGIDQSVCNATNSSNLTTAEKKTLILAAMNPRAGLIDYAFVDRWNENLRFGKYPPLGVRSASSGSIRDAWVKITAISPSVIEGNMTFLNSSGRIRAEYAFTFVLPDKTAPGDCKTTYSPEGYNYTLAIFQNGIQINKNSQKDAQFALNNSSVGFDANLSIVAGYQARHYVWVTHCDDDGDCHETCEYAYTQNVTDSLNLSDSEAGVLYNFSYGARSLVDRNHSGLLDFWFSYNVSKDFSGIVLESGNANIRIKGTTYRLRALYEPYNVLAYEAVPGGDTTFSYYAPILYDNQTGNTTAIQRTIRTLIPSSGNCTLIFQSHFNRMVIPEFCNVTNQTPVFNATIVERRNDSTVLEVLFYDNATGTPLTNKQLFFSFNGQEENATTGHSGRARITLPITTGIVRISFTTDFETKSAQTALVLAPELEINEQMLLELILLGLVLYLAYRVLKRWIGNGMA